MVVPRPHPYWVSRRVLVMERMRGFAFDDVESMHDAGLDTNAILRAGLIACLEGALIHGVFHGDLHGGNLLVQPERAHRPVRLRDHRPPGRRPAARVPAAAHHRHGRGREGPARGAARPGRLPADTDIDAVYADLELDQPVKDPTQMSSDELVLEMQDLVKKLLAYGARAPKDLMLFVKNLMFLNAATADPRARPRPPRARSRTSTPTSWPSTASGSCATSGSTRPSSEVDVDAVKASLLVPAEVERLTFRELQERRKLIVDRMSRTPTSPAGGARALERAFK